MAGQAMGMGGAGVGACSTGGLAHTQVCDVVDLHDAIKVRLRYKLN